MTNTFEIHLASSRIGVSAALRTAAFLEDGVAIGRAALIMVVFA